VTNASSVSKASVYRAGKEARSDKKLITPNKSCKSKQLSDYMPILRTQPLVKKCSIFFGNEIPTLIKNISYSEY
jgi:hypothetical protein